MKTRIYLAASLLSLAALNTRAQDPWIANLNYPMDTNACVGATVSFRVIASTAYPPLTNQWQHDGYVLSGATNSILVISNLTADHAGVYLAMVSNAIGGFTNSRTATLTVYPAQFADVTVAAGVTNAPGYCCSAAWGDYNNDQLIDLHLAIGADTLRTNALFLNNGNRTFTRVGSEAGPITTDRHDSLGCAWIDFNNDGYRDMVVLNGGWWASRNDLYWNNGDGTFRSGNVGNLTQLLRFRSWSACADYDGDGWNDIYVAEATSSLGPYVTRLYHATGSGTFESVDFGPTLAYANDAVWGDYDNDGDPDLFICGYTSTSTLWRNDGRGNFTPVANGLPSSAQTLHASWADCDRDGDLDIALSSFSDTRIYRNDGTNGFVLAATLAAVSDGAWADYDNDGHLDLLVVGGQNTPRKPGLFHNDGNGNFTRVSDIFTEVANNWLACPWGDFDNDGFMDVILTHQYSQHRLYRNLTNANHWIKFKLVGSASNRDAIGAKVRVQATIAGQSVWQMQEVNGGYQWQNDTRLNFGLGDATNIDLVRIEWPSGNVHELSDLSADRIATVTEQTLITPVRPTASLGGSISLSRTALGGASYQWRLDGVDLVGQTNRILTLTNLTADMAGRYSVVASNATALITNFVYLFVDTQFTKITEGPLVTDLGSCDWEAAAGDYDGDGYEDLFVPRWKRGLSALYHNNQDGTFTATSVPPSQSSSDDWAGAAWGDLDNDGQLDLLAIRDRKPSYFFWNNGGGTFSSNTFDTLSPWNVAVADYDRDGQLDLYFSYAYQSPNRLYRNAGDRTFTRMSATEVGPVVGISTYGGATWVDYDDDGWPDLCAPHYQQNRLYMFHNEGNGRLAAATNLSILETNKTAACAWGDCDNDGRLDVFIAGGSGGSRLFLNLGGGEFKAGSLSFPVRCNGASWADYDNDGFLDLFASRYNTITNTLFHNNGDGTFTEVKTGSIVNDVPIGWPTTASMWGTWFDYDNNGFLDLYVVNGDDNATVNTANFLFRNNGNSNAWLKVKLIGTTSNRDAVGAKVRVRATYAGQSRWQRCDITGGDAINGAQSYAHFGLGNATTVHTLRIEWPSGVIEEFSGIAPRQSLTIVEPSLIGAFAQDGKFHLAMTMSTNRVYCLEASTDLVNWTTLTNCTGSGSCTPVEYVDPQIPAAGAARFYRMK